MDPDEIYQTVYKQRFDSLDRRMDKLHDVIVGSNGDGLKGRVIRLEEFAKNMKRWRNGIVTAIATLFTACMTWINTK